MKSRTWSEATPHLQPQTLNHSVGRVHQVNHATPGTGMCKPDRPYTSFRFTDAPVNCGTCKKILKNIQNS